MGREIAGKFEIPYWDQMLCGMNHITKWGYCFYKERPNNSFFFSLAENVISLHL